MKILLVIDNLSTGGAQRQMINLAIGLSEKHSVYLLTYFKENFYSEQLSKTSINHITYPKRRRFDYQIVRQIVKISKKNQIDLICAFLFTPSLYTLVAKPFLPKVKLVISERTFEGLVSRFNKNITRRLYFLANKITTNSYHQKLVLENHQKNYSNRIKYIPNGVDVSIFKPLKDEKIEIPIKILGIGRVSDLKNTKLLIEAIAILREKHQVIVKVEWLGVKYAWSTDQTSYYNDCVELLKDKKLDDNWIWHGQKSNVENYLRNTNLLVHASKGEGFPNVICEALASGVPVIASNVYDHPVIIKDGVNGYLFNPQNADDLADRILKYYNLNDKEKIKLAKVARVTALENFANDIYVKNYHELFSRTLK